MQTDRPPFVPTALRISAGVIIWAAHFGVIYAYTGLACARRVHATGVTWIAGVPWVIGISTAIAVALMALFIAPALRARGPVRFVDWMSAGVAGLALIGVLFEAVPVFMVPVCG